MKIPFSFHSTLIVIVASLLVYSVPLKAQPKKGKFITASVGLGLTAPEDESEAGGSGFYAQAEYVIALSKWFGVRPYAGIIFTTANNDSKLLDEQGYEVTTNAFLCGGKVRLLAPIPYVAPYLETGLGLSVGSFKTRTEFTDIEKKGIVTHIPFSLGLAVGRKNNFDIAFTYYFQQSVKQFSGAVAFGYSFPLD